MPSVFKLGRNKGKKGAPWHFEFKDEFGKKRMRRGFTDKGSTKQLAQKLETEAELRRKGLIDVELEQLAENKHSAIEVHLEAFKTSLRGKDNTAKHIQLTLRRIRTIVEGCEWQTLGEMNADDVEAFMVEFQDEKGIGNRTYNHYLQAIDSWANWLAQPSRRILGKNPFAGIPRRNAEVDVRHPRRALTPEEFSALVRSARDSGISIQCFDGETRARIYTLSYMTGLRKSEIASLTKSSFDFLSTPKTVTVEAKASKHRKQDVLPLHPELVPLLEKWTKQLPPGEPLFPKLAKRRAWKCVKLDLERIGIPYKNENGIADFHAAGRHSHITGLLKNGATLPEAQKLARHSSVMMTMKYVHIGIDDQAKALKSLPAPSNEKCQDIVRKPSIPDCHEQSQSGSNEHRKNEGQKCKNPAKSRVSGGSDQSLSADDIDRQKVEAAGRQIRRLNCCYFRTYENAFLST